MNIAASRRHTDDGFTLVELITVIIIVGVLAGIAIPIYFDQQKKAHDVAVKSDLNTIAKQIRFYGDENQALPTLTVVDRDVFLNGEKVASLSPGVVFGGLSGTALNEWCIDATHPDGDRARVEGYKFSSPDEFAGEGQCV